MSGNEKSSSRYFGDSSQLTNWILDSGTTCHMTPQVSDLIPCLLEDTDRYIEVAYGHYVAEMKKRQVHIKLCDNNRIPFIAILHKIILALDLCDRLF